MSTLVQQMLGSRSAGCRRTDDFHQTTHVAFEALLTVETFAGPVWECACGLGAIIDALRLAHPEVFADPEAVP
jgi:hypothetical protein